MLRRRPSVPEGNPGRVAPEVLELIELTGGRVKDVDDEIDVVQQYPRPPRLALDMIGTMALLPEGLLDVLRYGAHLDVGRTGADHEVVGG